ncbi:MAG TPA: flagellar biosynthesis anti-sigma factor FlgM [Clostridiales bacterium]|nr:flagellar biosynthesis anti-sigma factor FlgM [Clostridiales bacterium]
MKIWGNIPGISGIYGKNKVNRVNETSGVSSKNDEISISEKARDYQFALKHLKDIPDIRRDRVDELANKIKSGNYNVNGKEIADKIIKSAFDKKA